MSFFSFDLTGLTSKGEGRGRSKDSRSSFALRRFVYYTLQYQLICIVCRLQHLRINVITESDACTGFSINRDVMKRHQITNTVLWGRRGRRRLMRRGRPQRLEPATSDLSQHGPAPGPRPPAPGPGSAEERQHQQKINKPWAWDCLEVWGERRSEEEQGGERRWGTWTRGGEQ